MENNNEKNYKDMSLSELDKLIESSLGEYKEDCAGNKAVRKYIVKKEIEESRNALNMMLGSIYSQLDYILCVNGINKND